MKNRLASLVEHLGGPKGLVEVLKLFYDEMKADLMIGFFFEGLDLEPIIQKQSEFILRAAGLTSSYSGKAPSVAHLHLPPILPGHFDRRAEILKQVLSRKNIPHEDIQAWLEFEALFRKAIVQ